MRLCAIVAAMVIGGMTANVPAGAPTGEDVLTTYSDAMGHLKGSLSDDVDVITASCIAKLAALDARGATDDELETFASACFRKVLARVEKTNPKLRKLVTRTVSSLGNLFEPELVDQVAQVVATHQDLVDDVGVFIQDSADAMQAALAAEIAD